MATDRNREILSILSEAGVSIRCLNPDNQSDLESVRVGLPLPPRDGPNVTALILELFDHKYDLEHMDNHPHEEKYRLQKRVKPTKELTTTNQTAV